ncbi:extracellular solute-binding protein [Ruminococcus flavefaciens]|uniref:ABC-type glycerol-3-phosphate transport system, substrate-binding protein n=1 Tax=Ruminococcus flavefaciens TaxID=1265 RepID=A0A1M7KS77_RUMFL|nr:extracellular solute-binding protein [Ruminococcus flavefaciens]SHM68390.1 ABC-type glycerol-3-phosphate transport system, substrate-binding protein [Ruminococcus flavefaciens]
MEKNFSKRITALSAALAVIAGSAASCGKKSESKAEKKTAQELMAASYRAELIDTDVEFEDVRDMKQLSDGRIFISKYDYESTSPSFYIADSDFTNFEEVKMDLGIKDSEDVNIASGLAPDGNIVVMVTFIDYGDMEKPNYDDPNFDYEHFDYEELERNIKQTYKIYTVDLEGKVKSENEIKSLDDYKGEGEGRLSVGNFCACSGGKAILTIYGNAEEHYVVINSDGNVDQEIDLDGMDWINNISPIDEKTFAILGGGSSGECVKFIDSENFKPTGEELKFEDLGNSSLNGIFKGNDEYSYFVSTEKGISGANKDGKTTEIINWVDSDMGSGYVSAFIPVANGEFIIYYSDYSSGSENGIYRLTKRDASELENTKVISIGVLYDDWEVKQKVATFNKSHDGIRFKIEDYSKYDEYDDDGMATASGEGQLKKDIVSGKAPDIIVSYNHGIIDSLYKKGLFMDLYEMLDKDADMSKDDIMPNVLNACEIGGKLYSLSPSFSVQTLAAKKSNCDKENWTIDEMIDTYKNLPKNMRFTTLDCKESMLSMVVAVLGDAIDYEKGTCNFDTPDVRKLLNFIDQFPGQEEVMDMDDHNAMMEMFGGDNIKENKVLLQNMYIGNFVDYTETLKGQFEGDISFVGYPSSNGKGSVLCLEENFAILSNSEYKDECWEFIKMFFTKSDDEDEENGGMYGFPSLKSEFDKMAEKSMKKPTYKDENGKTVEQDLTYYTNDGKEIKIDPLNEKEKDFIVDYIKNTTQISDSMDPDVSMILMEEIMAYLKGEKTADEVIDLIQNRVSLLVSEQS